MPKHGTQNYYDPWSDPTLAGKPIRYQHDARDPSSIMVEGQLKFKPLPPEEPLKQIETWERQLSFVHGPLTISELFQKLPRGVHFDNIKMHTDKSGLITFEVKRVTENIFYEEELKVYHAKLAVYELELKVWNERVRISKSRELAEYEARFAEPQPVHVSRESVANDQVTREWLESVRELKAASDKKAAEQPPVVVSQIQMIGESVETVVSALDDGLTVKPT